MTYFGDLNPYFGEHDADRIVFIPTEHNVRAVLMSDGSVTLALDFTTPQFGKIQIPLEHQQFADLTMTMHRLLTAPDEEVKQLRRLLTQEQQDRQAGN